MKFLSYILIALFCVSCAPKKENEKWQNKRANIIDVKNDVKEIDTEPVLIGSYASVYICGQYFVVTDHKSYDKLVHVFDKQTFKHLFSFGDIGRGPTEITVLGAVAWNEADHEFYVTDHGQRRILRYNVDSLLNDSLYPPTVKVKFGDGYFPDDYYYINDTLSYGSFVKFVSDTFKQTTGKWNMKTGESELIDYANPPSDPKKRVAFAVAPEHNTLIECNRRYDLISLYNLDGELQCDVYGPNWDAQGDRNMHFKDVIVCGDKIVASYAGGDWIENDDAKVLHVFSISGDYLATWDVGREINHICYDDDNKRIIMNLNDEYQFAYIDVDKLFTTE